ncbi:hypothetical protein UNSWDHB_2215 [Dehalobacter sp. UNSWDHB]|nr:hypothetical protein UNSWDHB_2215 [Dehalobacter sp. UNSWDHB]
MKLRKVGHRCLSACHSGGLIGAYIGRNVDVDAITGLHIIA